MIALRIIAWLCYVSVAIAQLDRPGLEYDETFWGPAALGRTRDFTAPSAIAPASRFSPLAFTTFAPSLGAYVLPVMLMPYWGALKVYLQAPVFALWGVSPWTIRLPAIVLGAFTLLLFERLCACICSPAVALLALILLASDPSFIFYIRHDFGGAALTLFLVIAPLWCLVRWRETTRIAWWSLAFFLFGFGLYHRLDYLGFLTALASVTIVCRFFPSFYGALSSLLPFRQLGKREISFAGLGLFLGMSPLLFFAWQRPTIAATVLSQAVSSPRQDFVSVVQLKGYVLWTVLNGMSMYDFFANRCTVNIGKVVAADGEVRVGSFAAAEQSFPLSSLFTGTLTPYWLLFFSVVLWWFHPPPTLRVLGALLFALLLWLFVMPSALRGHHFVVFLPFAQAFLAVSLLWMWEQARLRWTKVVMIVLVVACIGANLAVALRYHHFLIASGGQGVWSTAIYDLSSYLREQCATQRCFLGDWGMGTQVMTLAQEELLIEEVFWTTLQGHDRPFDDLQRIKDALFVFYTDPYVNFSRPKRLFFMSAAQAGLTLEIVRVFPDRQGTPILEVIKVKRED